MYLDPQHYHLVIEAVCQLRRLYQVEAISACPAISGQVLPVLWHGTLCILDLSWYRGYSYKCDSCRFHASHLEEKKVK